MFIKVQNFKYFGSEVSYENGKDIQQKLAKFAQILVIPINTLTSTLIQKFSIINAYNALALLSFIWKQNLDGEG
jgi:hypothetical protein